MTIKYNIVTFFVNIYIILCIQRLFPQFVACTFNTFVHNVFLM